MADGLKINGSKLIEGANMALPKGISITGGLAGDDENFHRECGYGERCSPNQIEL